MAALVDRAMLEGAIGLSSGLEYIVGSYASTDEVVALAKAAAQRRGIYISHIRDEADLTIDAVSETIAIGERAGLPAQITHIKLGTVGVWGKAAEVVAIVEAARARGHGRHGRRVPLPCVAVEPEGAGARTSSTRIRPA